MKIDPYKHKERYLDWKKSIVQGVPGLSRANSDIVISYVTDMEKGINVSSMSVKGSRGYPRLNTIKDKMILFCKKFKELYNLDDITQIKENQLMSYFSDMKAGIIKTVRGKRFRSVETYSKIFKAFWHWHQKVNRKEGVNVPDITIDLDTRQEKPKWVYLNEAQVKKLCEVAKYEYKILIMFLLDSGIRSPTELINVKVSDLYNNCKELHIREEISKTFGRRIKLMICSNLLKDYIAHKNLRNDDYLFQINPVIVNQYLKRVAVKALGNKTSEAGQKYSELSMYDFRHISCCYWLPRYKSESALKYRFGWKKSDKIHYYSELLGMKDTISEEDLLVDTTKTELEQEQVKLRKENEILKDKMFQMEEKMKMIVGMFGGVKITESENLLHNHI